MQTVLIAHQSVEQLERKHSPMRGPKVGMRINIIWETKVFQVDAFESRHAYYTVPGDALLLGNCGTVHGFPFL